MHGGNDKGPLEKPPYDFNKQKLPTLLEWVLW